MFSTACGTQDETGNSRCYCHYNHNKNVFTLISTPCAQDTVFPLLNAITEPLPRDGCQLGVHSHCFMLSALNPLTPLLPTAASGSTCWEPLSQHAQQPTPEEWDTPALPSWPAARYLHTPRPHTSRPPLPPMLTRPPGLSSAFSVHTLLALSISCVSLSLPLGSLPSRQPLSFIPVSKATFSAFWVLSKWFPTSKKKLPALGETVFMLRSTPNSLHHMTESQKESQTSDFCLSAWWGRPEKTTWRLLRTHVLVLSTQTLILL